MASYDPGQIAQLRLFLAQGRYTEAYKYLYGISIFRDFFGFPHARPGIDQDSLLYVKGVADVNAMTGVGYESIRLYLDLQAQIRFGASISDAQFKAASDTLAKVLIERTIALGTLPSMAEVAQTDITVVAKDLLRSELGGAPGAVFLMAMGQDKPFHDLLLEKPGDSYDLLAAMKSAIASFGSTDSWVAKFAFFFETMWNNSKGLLGTSVMMLNSLADANSFLQQAYGGVAPLLGTLFGDNVIIGRQYEASLVNGTGWNDYQIGGTGNDRLLASSGSDIMDGGAGVDTADFSSSGRNLCVDIRQEATTASFTASVIGEGTDRLFNIEKIICGAGSDTVSVHALHGWMQQLDGGSGSDVIDFSGLAGPIASGTLFAIKNFETLICTAHDDSIVIDSSVQRVEGGAGNDRIEGSDSSNLISGGAGQDVLIGNGGSDCLSGGAGNDVLSGGSGSDRFNFEAAGFGRDVITDFWAGAGATDQIAISSKLLASWAAVIAAATQAGADTVITLGSDSIVLKNIAIGSLAPDDFMFMA